MNNVKFVEMPNTDGDLITYAIIDRGNDEYTSMLKSAYDEMLANADKL